MPDIGQLLNGFAPAAPQRKQRVAPPATAAEILGATGTAITAQRKAATGPYDTLMQAVAPLDPLMRAIAMPAIEEALGVPRGSIPMPEEYARQQMEFQQASFAAHKSLLKDKITDIQAQLADMPDPMKKNLEIDEDTLKKDPVRWVAFARATGSDLSMGDLMRAGMLETPEQRKEAAAKKEVEQTSQLRTQLENLKALNVGTSETPPLTAIGDFGGLAKKAIATTGEAMDADLLPSGWQFWTGPDANSLQGLERAYLLDKRQAPGSILAPLVAKGFLEAAGDQIGRVLKEAPTARVKSEQGDQTRILINDNASLHAATLAFHLAQDAGMNISDLLSRIGVDANAIDTDSYEAAAKAAASE